MRLVRQILSKNVQKALDSKTPIVALESTIISHGMPYPENLRTALEVEDIVYANGATPATIAILDGTPRIGLDREDLERFAKLGPEKVQKCSRRDLAFAVAAGLNGSTTVASTMFLASKANIPVFVTGGIGGVHRGAFTSKKPTLDVSADLTELGKTSMAVVCAGVKSVLDIGHTLEFLETMGVTTITVGQEEFPAFFTRDSGFRSPSSVSSSAEVARIIQANRELDLNSGVLVAVPNPDPLDQTLHDTAVSKAILEMEDLGIQGKDSTPFLLKRINELTGGSSLEANIALIKSNAKVGAEIATELNSLRKPQLRSPPSNTKGGVLVVGGAAVDMVAKPHNVPIWHTSNPGTINESLGGVGRNIAETVAKLQNQDGSSSVSLFTAVAEDNRGRSIIRSCEERGIDSSMIQTFANERTATYCSIADQDGDLLVSIGDMEVFDNLASFQPDERFDKYGLIVLDANMPVGLIERICHRASRMQIPVIFEPVSVSKAGNVVSVLDKVSVVTPNRDEVSAIADIVQGTNRYAGGSIAEDARIVARHMHCDQTKKYLLVTMGEEGVLQVTANPDGSVVETLRPAKPVPSKNIVNANGCGDTFTGALAWSVMSSSRENNCMVVDELENNLEFHVGRCMKIAALSLQSQEAVPQDFTNANL